MSGATGLRPALLFDGPSDFVVCGDVGTGGLVALAVECWARPDTLGQGNRPLVAKYGTGAREWALYLTLDGRLYFVAWDVSGGVSAGYSAVGAVGVGAWRHLAGCYDAVGERVRVWVDGTDVTEGMTATGNAVRDTGQAVRMGGSLADPEIGYAGGIGPARLSSSCRNGYVDSFARYPAVDANTLAQWNMSEGSGLTLDNAEGSAGYDGTITGATWIFMPWLFARQTLHVRRRGRGGAG